MTTQTAEEVYAELGGWTFDDGGQLLPFVDAYVGTGQLDDLNQLVRDSPNGPGWSVVLDVGRCPVAWLPWLAQWVGVVLPGGLTEAQQRAYITNVQGFHRGSVGAILGAARAFLVGGQRVDFYERYGGAYVLRIVTYLDESPDPSATEAAIITQKPGGIILIYVTQAGPVIDQLVGTINDQTDIIDDFAYVVP